MKSSHYLSPSFYKSDRKKLLVAVLLIVAIPASIWVVWGGKFLRGKASTLPGQFANVAQMESDSGTFSGNASVVTDANASGGTYVKFGGNSQTGISNFQPSAPYYSAFFYLWYKNSSVDGSWSYWNDISNSPPNTWFSKYIPDPNPSAFDPINELYSSHNYDTFKWQVAKMAEAKIEVAIASWWGQNRKEDQALTKVLTDFMGRADNPYPNLRWAFYYEKEAIAPVGSVSPNDPTVTELVNDLTYIKNTYGSSPHLLKVNGKPVMFVYGDVGDNPGTMTQRWKDANAQLGNYFYVSLKLFSGYKTDPNQPDSWHQYAPAARSGTHAPDSAFVSPGFWLDDNVSPERLGRDAASFETAVQGLVSANTTWKLIETWNEWGEGTSVEPGEMVKLNTTTGKDEVDPAGYPFKNLYVDILNRNLPPLEQGTGVAAAPQSVKIAAAGDMVGFLGTPTAKHLEVSNLIIQENPAHFLALGDVQYEYGEYQNFIDYYNPSYGRFKSTTIPAIGNHEYGDSVNSTQTTPDCDVLITGDVRSYACGYFDYFNGKGNLDGPAGERGKGYFATNIGAWRVYTINSNCSGTARPGCSTTSPQYAWLKADLQANPRQCSMIIAHHPYITSDERNWRSSSTNLNDPASHNSFDTATLEPLLHLFYNAGGDVMLVGHSHFYERFKPFKPGLVQNAEVYPFNGSKFQNISDPTQDDAYGIRQIIIGTGGRNVYTPNNLTPDGRIKLTKGGVPTTDTDPAADGIDPTNPKYEQLSEAASIASSTYGAIFMNLSSTGYDWVFKGIPGVAYTDNGTGSCHGAPPVQISTP